MGTKLDALRLNEVCKEPAYPVDIKVFEGDDYAKGGDTHFDCKEDDFLPCKLILHHLLGKYQVDE
jgi:hypothetical protein